MTIHILVSGESRLVQTRDSFADTDLLALLDEPAMKVSLETQQIVLCLLYDVANPLAVAVLISRHG
jgi:ABC-type cobalamin/Fe3+-siderophores transport system ATPase subunit